MKRLDNRKTKRQLEQEGTRNPQKTFSSDHYKEHVNGSFSDLTAAILCWNQLMNGWVHTSPTPKQKMKLHQHDFVLVYSPISGSEANSTA